MRRKPSCTTLNKLAFLKGTGVATWQLGDLSPNRLKRLAQIARRATGQAIQRMPEERRYPLLVAFLHQSLLDIVDETIDQFDLCLAEAYAQAGHDLDDFRSSIADITNEMVQLCGELARVVLDPTVPDSPIRARVSCGVPFSIAPGPGPHRKHLFSFLPAVIKRGKLHALNNAEQSSPAISHSLRTSSEDCAALPVRRVLALTPSEEIGRSIAL